MAKYPQMAKQVAKQMAKVKYMYIKALNPRWPDGQLCPGDILKNNSNFKYIIWPSGLAIWGINLRFWLKNGQMARQSLQMAIWPSGV